eukprot:TRINITY_DN5099_c2_g1_i2.p1 TRINITY_DN5099_c2_g1~~TRINITY_DN5099_c2_g1_i2.p1  ORF type:complete len:200 (+),score=38.81 TRINITY_DN5099_c2_g1_i2:46-600(+)
MAVPPIRHDDEKLRELNRQRDILDGKKDEMGPAYYGFGGNKSDSTKGFDFKHMTSRQRAWNDPVLYHGSNAAVTMGGLYGLYFFFMHPVHNKLYHVAEMTRRTVVGSLYSFPLCLGVAWYVRQKAILENKQKMQNSGDAARKEFLALGGRTMSTPPDPTYSGPQGMPAEMQEKSMLDIYPNREK